MLGYVTAHAAHSILRCQEQADITVESFSDSLKSESLSFGAMTQDHAKSNPFILINILYRD
jgi:hypothetical protein